MGRILLMIALFLSFLAVSALLGTTTPGSRLIGVPAAIVLAAIVSVIAHRLARQIVKAARF